LRPSSPKPPIAQKSRTASTTKLTLARMKLQIQSVIEKSAPCWIRERTAGLIELRAFAVGKPPISSPLWAEDAGRDSGEPIGEHGHRTLSSIAAEREWCVGAAAAGGEIGKNLSRS